MKLRAVDWNLFIKPILLTPSPSLLHSLVQRGKKDIISDLVLAEKVLRFRFN